MKKQLTRWRAGDSWRASLKQYALPKIGRKRVPEITAADVLAIVGGIWTSRHETAQKFTPGALDKIITYLLKIEEVP